ncbi:HAD family hydrolase [Psychrobacter immobilis]|uniref:HAD family hydrolase n=1 Tax=Psychrobacter immobilis TaxID=498 RepID=UPI001D104F1A|nr:HAD family hydrolase [Psychrobacter immobilis]
MELNNYKTIIFDCDGVVLNSNKVKTQAFYNTALAFGQAAAERLVKYHVERGGISRYKKFQWFIDNLNKEDLAQSKDQPNLDNLLSSYAAEVHKGLRSCQIAEGLTELREKTKDSIWLIVSGGDQAELRELFAERDIAQFFDGGIFGSPDTKEVIMSREREQGNIKSPAVFIGDSQYDYTAVESVGDIDFIFVTDWSEFTNYRDFFADKEHLLIVNSLSDLK